VTVTLILEGEEALTGLDRPWIECATGEAQAWCGAAAHDPPTARGEESLEREQRRRC